MPGPHHEQHEIDEATWHVTSRHRGHDQNDVLVGDLEREGPAMFLHASDEEAARVVETT